MNSQKNIPNTSIQEHILRHDIAQLIYEGDWVIEGTLSDRVKDITEHHLEDEDKVVKAIIATVREADHR